MTVIGTNTAAMRASNASTLASNALATSMERLSTGKRINSAKDDAAGLAISTRMQSQTRSMTVAIRNANDGISLAQTAEGALSETSNMLQRMKELATQSASGTLKDSDRTALQSEMSQLTAEIDNEAKTTTFNGVNLLDGSTSSVKLQTGINANSTISMSLANVSAATLGLTPQVSTALVVPATALTATDLVINGQAVGAGASADASATAAAINAVSANSNVVATAKNSVSATVGTVASGNTLVIGGTTVTMTAAEKSADAVAAKINSTLGSNSVIKASTDSNGKLLLTSSDGSNITVQDTNSILSGAQNAAGTAVTLGTSSATTLRGTVTLAGQNGTGITVAAGAGTLANSGLAAGSTSALSISSQTGASAAMAVIDAAMDQVSAARGNLGAVQNRLQSTVNNLTTTSTNLTDASSRITDTDFSTETTALAKAQILSQASTAMLAQANQSQQGVLSLLK